MKRILFAFLALMGLVAQVSPVQARISGLRAAEVGAIASPRIYGQAIAAQSVASEAVVTQADRNPPKRALTVSSHKLLVFIPAAQLRVDRALE